MSESRNNNNPVHVVRGASFEWQLAAHEPAGRPGILKRVMASNRHFPPGQLQMINWACLPVKTQSWPHYHEDLHEAFFLISGSLRFHAGDEIHDLSGGDMVIVPPRVVHVLINSGDMDAQLVVVGISEGKGGKTVMLENENGYR